MEEQRTGGERSKYRHREGAKKRVVQMHMQAKMEEKGGQELVWAGSAWMAGCAVTMPATEKSVCVVIAYLWPSETDAPL